MCMIRAYKMESDSRGYLCTELEEWRNVIECAKRSEVVWEAYYDPNGTLATTREWYINRSQKVD